MIQSCNSARYDNTENIALGLPIISQTLFISHLYIYLHLTFNVFISVILDVSIC